MINSKMMVKNDSGIECSWHSGFTDDVTEKVFLSLSEACTYVLRPNRKQTINVYANLATDSQLQHIVSDIRNSQNKTVELRDLMTREDVVSALSMQMKCFERGREIENSIGITLSARQQTDLREKVYIEHIQEVACAAYLNYMQENSAKQQMRIYSQDKCVYVVADVFDTIKHTPWEVKDCDSVHLLEHAHGQSDFQRIFANASSSCLWLFTEDSPRSNGRRNFKVFCNEVASKTDRYQSIILSKRFSADIDRISGVLATRSIIAAWNSHDRTYSFHDTPDDEYDDDCLFDVPLMPVTDDEFDDEPLSRRYIRKSFQDRYR